MTPEQHRAAAVQLLADVNDVPESPSAQRVLTQAAIAHALLGLLTLEMDKYYGPVVAACETPPL